MSSSSSSNTPSIPIITVTDDQGTSRAIGTNTFDAFLPSSHLTTMSDLAAAKQAKKDARKPAALVRKSSKRVTDALKMGVRSMKSKGKKHGEDMELPEGASFKVHKVVKVERKWDE
ncbi:hypothetical protein COCVIDRAFT_107341 [Bipolaris victoriae FI3]|uniref:Uncharacterized protein n=1 Tax=Bipolaris victoriae (strain FI3) TaxID=930091 RepID=W7E765_BIPV3|nr:hypothetical protein COCVIDRAFT_107341 [Bipolaris victoriae FI3]